AIGVLLSVLHDALMALGLLSLLQIEFDLNIIAGLMAVIGYSLNDSIVISDRLRDLLQSRTQQDIYACSDRAIKATFSRTLITSGTTLFTVGALLLFGGAALYGFAFTLFIGILVGTLSSITIASTVQELLGLSVEAYNQHEEETEEWETAP
ncbi:MAG: protein translocase subunit SecF, partial [Aeromonadaceae bacterium]|nr:protein translocase subunit SecF [Aeromonadaceae bacterium]